MNVKVVENNIRSDAITWRISTYLKVIDFIFMWFLTVFEILTFQIFDLENVSQGQRVQHS